MSVHHMSYIWSFFLFSLILFLEAACKKSCQPIADKLTDIQATKPLLNDDGTNKI